MEEEQKQFQAAELALVKGMTEALRGVKDDDDTHNEAA